MLFFTRSFLCIGAIVALAEGFGTARWGDASSDAVATATKAASEGIERFCRDDTGRCLAIAAAAAVAEPAAMAAVAPEPAGIASRPATLGRARPHRPKVALEAARLSSRAASPK